MIALVRSVSLQGCPIWRFNFSASLFLVTNVTIFSKNLIFHSSELVVPGDIPNGFVDHSLACQTQQWGPFALDLHQQPPVDPRKKLFRVGLARVKNRVFCHIFDISLSWKIS